MKFLKYGAVVYGALLLTALWFVPADPSPHGKVGTASNCVTIDQAPFTIRQKGRYCLTQDLHADANGILIKNAKFVTIDLGGHTLSGPVDPATEGYGIVGVNASHILIENGTISGFGNGVVIVPPSDEPNDGYNRLERLRIVLSTQRGAALAGDYNQVEDSEFLDIGGGMPPKTVVHTHGLYITGAGSIIRKNRFSEVRGTKLLPDSEGIALAVSGALNGTLVEGNVFINSPLADIGGPRKLSPSTFAVWFGGFGLGTVVARENRVENFVNGIVADTHATAIITDNEAKNVIAPFNIRPERRKQEDIEVAGADGQIAVVDGPRPVFDATLSSNSCVMTDPAAVSLAASVHAVGCETNEEITFGQLPPAPGSGER